MVPTGLRAGRPGRNYRQSRTGREREKILLEGLRQDRLDGLLRGESATARAQKEGEGIPDVVGELQSDELEQP